MSNIRLIARLDIKGPNLIKGIHLEGLRVLGDPQVFAQRYYEQGIDEIIYMDAVASLYERNNLTEIVKYTARNVFIPLTVGGGIRSVDDVYQLLRAGADKVAINTAATRNHELIKQISRKFGSQCMVLSIEAKKVGPQKWEVYTDNGRERTGIDVIEWVKRGEDLGAGEILLTSVDQEGTKKGFDVELVRQVSTSITIPVIASGGMGKVEHLVDVIREGKADAVAMADILHYDRSSLREIRDGAKRNGIELRSTL
ncbi:Imidazole glycerol phosphate synthase subunit HisF [Paenibacillus allorhizoplanae]|uniref:Imidazole glycerol phosphate synthase subunit HisF n=1 Tax=Paenibacillus allorhizoplanae TaxID=2905648 RepID=A0ABM9CKV4_9BACL|nr:imidazole glycerol phosphate synthase cyclase subunit [Paenibacillus allorhizoplanae]CAH1215771.1 Imidazole glycerol phosphate synthase subunit HisF [Paenibacillus allorhizoplanae]